MTRSIWIVLLVAGGCVNLEPREDPTQFYVLEGVLSPAPASVEGVPPGLSVGFKRLRLADYLGSPRIAVRRGAHRVTYAQFHRWGESVEQGISRSLAAMLAARGPFSRVDVVPWPAHARHDYVVQVDVKRFEGLAEGQVSPALRRGTVHLLATWEIVRAEDRQILARGTADHRLQGWEVEDYEALVAMLSEALDLLAAEMAAGFRGLPAAAPDAGR